MSRKLTLLTILEAAGERGVTTAEILQAGVGSRYGGRICELRKEGAVIEATREREGSWRYRLSVSPGLAQHTPRAGGQEEHGERGGAAIHPAVSPSLFEMPAEAPAPTSHWEAA